MKTASPALEAFIDEMIKRGAEKGYHPTEFMRMRQNHKTVTAISRLVMSGDLQSGFKRLHALGLGEWTIEAAVLKFPGEFGQHEKDCARFRQNLAKGAIHGK